MAVNNSMGKYPFVRAPATSAPAHKPPADADEVHWRSVVDNMLVEAVASVFISVTAVVYGNLGFDGATFSQPWPQLVPALATGLVMLTCKDECFFPPDATPTVTLLLWSLGAYDSWIQAGARLLGHLCGFGIAWLLCRDMPGLPPQALPLARPGGVIFGCELAATVAEHLAVVYLFLPLLPPNYSHSARFYFPKAHSKRSAHAQPPSNQTVLHAGLVFAVSHWCLRVTFLAEMNPLVTLLKALLASPSPAALLASPSPAALLASTGSAGSAGSAGSRVWDDCLLTVWGQAVGLLLAIAYAVSFAPKADRVWPTGGPAQGGPWRG